MGTETTKAIQAQKAALVAERQRVIDAWYYDPVANIECPARLTEIENELNQLKK